MNPKLTPEQREALRHSDRPVAVEDETDHRVYFLIDQSAMDTLRRQQDLDAVRQGIADMEAGRVAPLEQVMARVRGALENSPAQ